MMALSDSLVMALSDSLGLFYWATLWYNRGNAEVCPSGLRSTLGKRVTGQLVRRFESSRFRQF